MNQVRLYHSISLLLYLFLVFTVLLLGRNIILTITDTLVFIGFLIFSVFGMFLVTYMNKEARKNLSLEISTWLYFWHKRFIIIVSIGLHLLTFLGHLLSNQYTMQQYFPYTLFLIHLILLGLVLIKEIYFKDRYNRFYLEVGVNSISYLLFALTLYFVISPF